MNGYTVAEFEEIVAAFRKRYPQISVATDVIVGYPNETDDDFYQTCDLISGSAQSRSIYPVFTSSVHQLRMKLISRNP